MSESPQIPARPIRIPTDALPSAINLAGSLSAAGPRSNQDVVFVEVGTRSITSQVSRDGIPIIASPIDQDVLKGVVIGEPIIPYKIVSQSIPAGTAVPLGTSVDVVMVDARNLPVRVVSGTFDPLKHMRIGDAFQRLVAGKPQVLRLVSRASEGPLADADLQALRDLFTQAQLPIGDGPGQNVDAALATLQALVAFGDT